MSGPIQLSATADFIFEPTTLCTVTIYDLRPNEPNDTGTRLDDTHVGSGSSTESAGSRHHSVAELVDPIAEDSV